MEENSPFRYLPGNLLQYINAWLPVISYNCSLIVRQKSGFNDRLTFSPSMLPLEWLVAPVVMEAEGRGDGLAKGVIVGSAFEGW